VGARGHDVQVDTAIAPYNRGFQLLKKLGWVEGTALGAQAAGPGGGGGSGLLEPIKVVYRADSLVSQAMLSPSSSRPPPPREAVRLCGCSDECDSAMGVLPCWALLLGVIAGDAGRDREGHGVPADERDGGGRAAALPRGGDGAHTGRACQPAGAARVGAASVASFEAGVLTEIYICNVCSCQEILRRHGRE
jgi:hypothetical protein